MRQHWRRLLVGAGVLALIVLAAWATSYVSPLTPAASEEWSRGRVIGHSPVNRPAALSPASEGGVYLVWSGMDDRLVLARIGPDGTVLMDRPLSVSQRGRDPQIQVMGADRLHLLWREEEPSRTTIRYALLDGEGSPVREPLVLSDAVGNRMIGPRLLRGPEDTLYALWVDEEGIQWAAIGWDGGPVAQQVVLPVEAESLAAQVDEGGLVHLAWQQQASTSAQGIYYAVFDPERGTVAGPEEMTRVYLRAGQLVEGPALGLDLDTAYVLWVVQDLKEVSSEAHYAYFLIGLPQERDVKTIALQRGRDPSGIAPLEGQRSPLLVALSEIVRSEDGRTEPQIAVMALVRDQTPEFRLVGPGQAGGGTLPFPFAFDPGLAVARAAGIGWTLVRGADAEHVVTASNRPSLHPTMAADAFFDLHLVWLETGGFGRYRVVYASTAEGVKQAYNRLTPWDLADRFFSGLMQLSYVALAMMPMMILWALLPLTVLVFYHLLTGEENLETWGARIALGLVLVMEVGLTLLFPPRARLFLPALRWGIPLASAAIAAALTYWILRRRRSSVLFLAFFLFTFTDGLLQLVVYFVFLGGR